MQTLVLKKPISVAMGVSVAGHLVLLLMGLWLIGRQIQPAPSSWVLDLSLHTVVSDEHMAAADHQEATAKARVDEQESSSSAVADTPVAVAEGIQQPIPDTRKPAAQPSSREPVASLRPVEEPVEPYAAAPPQQLPEAMAQALPVQPLATGAPRTLKVTAPLETGSVSVAHVVMSADQQRMLDKKLRRWSQSFDGIERDRTAMSWKHRGHEYRANFEHVPAGGPMQMDQVRVRIETERDGARLSTDLHMKRLAFSNFAQFVNRWDPEVLVHDDVLSGRFHSNTRINLASDRHARPVFHGKVTTSSREVGFPDANGPVRRKDIFLGGLETGVRKILLPRRFGPVGDEANADTNNTHRFNDDTEIMFYADGSFGYRPVGSDAPVQRLTLDADVAYLIGAPRKTLQLRGVVRGKVLVYSPERITITGDLTYARHPLDSTTGSGDYLGLVSDKYVDIAPPEITGPGDLRIHASIYAKRRFAVRNYRKREEATLYLFGSLTAGTMSATEPRYATHIEYDTRLEDSRAPGFPVTDRYEVVGFDETWRIEPL